MEAFLQGGIAFNRIADVVDAVMQAWSSSEPESLGAVEDADIRARAMAREFTVGLKNQ